MARLPQLRAMESFEAVARLGSVSAAAGELGVSPGAVSQQVRRLEAYLGVTLLERRGRHLELTRWGRLYHAEIEGAFAQLLAAERPLRAALGGAPLVVSGLPTVAAKWLGRALYDWAREMPDVPVRLVSEEADAVGSGEAWDFRMDFGPPPADGPGAELFTDVAVPACAPSLLDGRSITTPDDLLALPRLRIGWSARYDRFVPPNWEAWAERHGLALPPGAPAMSFALTASAIDAAVAGQGVVLGQRAMMQEELLTGRLVVPLDLPLPLSEPYALRWSRAALEKPGGAGLRDWLLARGRQEAARLRKDS